MIAHARRYDDMNYTTCGISRLAHSVELDLKHHTLCLNCKNIIDDDLSIKSHELIWSNKYDDYVNKREYINLGHTTIIVFVETWVTSIVINNTKRNKPNRIKTIDALEAVLLWVKLEFFNIPLKTFVESVAGNEAPS